jgi:ubiquinone biosynthesis protein UbiJ
MLTERIQALIDEKVAGSPRARELLAELEGRRMRIVARHTPWEITLLAHNGRLRLLRREPLSSDGAPPPAPDVTLEGSPLALLALQRADDPAEVIRRGDVVLDGDGEVGQRFQELASLLRPDIEEALSRVIGDIPAHGVGVLLRKALDWGRSAIETQAANVGEYLAHESRVLVPRAEARQFIDEVDALREQVDRLAARVALLESREQGR